MSKETVNPALAADMAAKGIDIELTMSILKRLNAGAFNGVPPIEAVGVPPINGKSIVPAGAAMSFATATSAARARLDALGIPMPATARFEGGSVHLGKDALVQIGERLYDRTAWGVLNGGSATSYADRKKNTALGTGVFSAIRGGFELLAPLCEGRPKGITPADINPDGTPGESFLILKMRAALLRAARFSELYGRPTRPALAFFQMTSAGTDAALAQADRKSVV